MLFRGKVCYFMINIHVDGNGKADFSVTSCLKRDSSLKDSKIFNNK
jgi:hypothetical protein